MHYECIFLSLCFQYAFYFNLVAKHPSFNNKTKKINPFLKDLVYLTTRVPDTSDTGATRVPRLFHDCNTSVTGVWYERRMCNTSSARTKKVRLKNFDFHNNTSENMFLHPYVSYMVNERLQKKEQFHSKNYLSEMYFKSAPQRQNFAVANAISKSYPVDCSCKYPCSFAHS